MIDFIKTKHIAVNIDSLDFNVSVSERTGEMRNVKICEIDGLIFIDKTTRLHLKGSLHKYYNKGKHNYNDFSIKDLNKVINDLQTRFGIDPELTELENLEFGVNIELPYKVDRVLNSLVLHKGEPFNKFHRGKGVECNHTQYFIKIYDKGKQFSLPYNLLRVEIKVIKMAYFQSQKIKIKTLSHLNNIKTLKNLRELLFRTINEIIITDTTIINKPEVIDADKLILANGSNPNYWNSIKPNSKEFTHGANNPEYKRQRKKYYRELQRFENVLNKYNSEIKQFIAAKVRDKFTDLIYKIERIEHPIREDKFTDLKTSKGTNLPLVYTVNLSPVCLTCKKDISHKKKTAKFCSKKCKNSFTNPILNKKNNFKRKILRRKQQPELFPVENYLTKQQIELLYSVNSIYKPINI